MPGEEGVGEGEVAQGVVECECDQSTHRHTAELSDKRGSPMETVYPE